MPQPGEHGRRGPSGCWAPGHLGAPLPRAPSAHPAVVRLQPGAVLACEPAAEEGHQVPAGLADPGLPLARLRGVPAKVKSATSRPQLRACRWAGISRSSRATSSTRLPREALVTPPHLLGPGRGGAGLPGAGPQVVGEQLAQRVRLSRPGCAPAGEGGGGRGRPAPAPRGSCFPKSREEPLMGIPSAPVPAAKARPRGVRAIAEASETDWDLGGWLACAWGLRTRRRQSGKLG